MQKICVSALMARVMVRTCAAAVNLALLHPVRAWSRVLRVGLNSGKTRMAPYNAKVQLAVTQCNGKRCRSQLLLIDIVRIIATAQQRSGNHGQQVRITIVNAQSTLRAGVRSFKRVRPAHTTTVCASGTILVMTSNGRSKHQPAQATESVMHSSSAKRCVARCTLSG